jgi:hypothetical protein
VYGARKKRDRHGVSCARFRPGKKEVGAKTDKSRGSSETRLIVRYA